MPKLASWASRWWPILDTNCDPEGVDYPIPGNDDAARAIALYCDLAARAALDGMAAQLGAAGVDLGELEQMAEEAVADEAPPAEEAAAEAPAEAPKLKPRQPNKAAVALVA